MKKIIESDMLSCALFALALVIGKISGVFKFDWIYITMPFLIGGLILFLIFIVDLIYKIVNGN